MINGPEGAFGGRMIHINIDPFNKKETLEYVNKKSNNIKFNDDSFERFYNCTRGIPAYINSLLTILPNNIETTGEIIKEAIVTNIDNIAIMWLLIWGGLTNIEKEIVIQILENEDNVNLKNLNNELKYSPTTISKYLDLLINKGIVEYKSNKIHYYRFYA